MKQLFNLARNPAITELLGQVGTEAVLCTHGDVLEAIFGWRRRENVLLPEDELLAAYLEDFRQIFGVALSPFWVNVARIPMYSPVFDRRYRNPPVRSTTWRNVYFAGNYRTFPSVASTGTALASGLEAGRAVLEDHARGTDVPDAVALPSH